MPRISCVLQPLPFFNFNQSLIHFADDLIATPAPAPLSSSLPFIRRRSGDAAGTLTCALVLSTSFFHLSFPRSASRVAYFSRIRECVPIGMGSYLFRRLFRFFFRFIIFSTAFAMKKRGLLDFFLFVARIRNLFMSHIYFHFRLLEITLVGEPHYSFRRLEWFVIIIRFSTEKSIRKKPHIYMFSGC